MVCTRTLSNQSKTPPKQRGNPAVEVRTYLRPNPDKRLWEKVDHYASFLYWATSENTADQNGIFLAKLPDDIVHQRVWKVLQYSGTRVTPSHLPKPPTASDPDVMRTSPAIPQGTDDDSEETSFSASVSPSASSDDAHGDDIDDILEGGQPEVPSGGLVPLSTFHTTPAQRHAFEKAKALPDDEESASSDFRAGKIQPMTVGLKLQYKERSMVPNFSDPYWRYLFINKACNAYGD
ncbi:MAG: hypothetical protein Q9174_006367 [Haloplaca sp. 1 TL-2023]